MVYLGADIGGTKIAVVLGTAQAEIIASSRFATSSFAGPCQALDGIEAAFRQLLEANNVSVQDVARIGVSCGGPLDSRRGLVLSPPNLPGWDEIPVCEVLHSKFGRAVRLENDANAAAQAEWAFGAGRGTQHMVFLTCSTGMGAGLILDGRLYHGARDLAGEAGHIRLTDEGPVGYRKAGSFEGWASGAGLFDLTGRPAEEIGRMALAGDPEALALIEHTGEMLGRGIAIMCDILNPELVVCGTMAVKLGDLLLAPARRVLAQEALDPCPIVPAALGADFGNKAALTVAILEE
jgi:glucokinase